ncbi:pentapeptide repeat-containing protein [Arthrobacter sp. ISL-30]|uniref:pentapeptide repeat-containing protein n=1 Tax=Arthrobacter sp. ISL-30 TaxID=2819109 RepID=UPI001BEA93BD|nr:pentapeptide repeat-containing protein [Arthrobacter sp. ISL-30]MBT2515712.1 pentapeptide repeat-containing protein [Arthrobacter sp. ISL-30]
MVAAGKAAGKLLADKVAPPRLSSVQLDELREELSPVFARGESYDGLRFSQIAADDLDLGGADFIECELDRVSLTNTQLRGATFRDCILTEPFAPVLLAARSTWREVEITNPRWGSAELYEGMWQSVKIDGGKLDYVNLRGSKLADVLISGCIINELDLGGCTINRLALKDCRIGTIDVGGARLKDMDLRSSDFKAVNGLGSIAGAVVDDYQLSLLSPLLAAHLGIRVV